MVRGTDAEVLCAGRRDKAVILHAEADAEIFGVNADINAEDHVRRDRLAECIDNIVHVVADMVRTAVPHVFANLIVRGQQTDLFSCSQQ